MRALLLVVLVLAACGRDVKKPGPQQAAAPAPEVVKEGSVVERLERVFSPRRCRVIDPDLLKGTEPAQGVLTNVDSVAEARGDQVRALSKQLAKIAAAFQPKGCVELKR